MSLPLDFIEFTKEEAGTEEFDFFNGEFSARRLFIGPWENRLDFVLQFLYTDIITGASQTNFTPVNTYPDFPGLIPSRVSIKPIGVPSCRVNDGALTYEKAKIIATYSAPTFSPGTIQRPPGEDEEEQEEDEFQVDDTAYLTESLDTSIEEINIPEQAATYNDIIASNPAYHQALAAGIDPTRVVPPIPQFITVGQQLLKPAQAPQKLIIPIRTYRIKQKYVPRPNWGLIDAFEGKINAIPFRGPSYRVGAGTLLYLGISGTRQHTLGGIRVWELEHTFLHKTIGWNYAYDDTGKLVKINVIRDPNNNLATTGLYSDNAAIPGQTQGTVVQGAALQSLAVDFFLLFQ